DIHNRVDQSFENVPALLRLFQLKARAADDHLAAMIDEMLDQLLEPHGARLAVHQRDVDHADGDLARRVLEQLPHDQFGIGVALQIDNDADLVLPPGMIVGVADFLEQVLLDTLADRFQYRLANDAIRKLVDDD